MKNLRDAYKYYRTVIAKDVTRTIYLDIVQNYFKFIVAKVLAGHKIKLPLRFGLLYIQGHKYIPRLDENGKLKNGIISWGKTRKLWRENAEAKLKKIKVYIDNSHSDGYSYKWFWSQKNVLVRNKLLYVLDMTRENSRAVWTEVNKGKKFHRKN